MTRLARLISANGSASACAVPHARPKRATRFPSPFPSRTPEA